MKATDVLRSPAAMLALGATLATGAWVGQERWQGMLTAQPAAEALMGDAKALGLADFRVSRIVVSDLPEPLRDELSNATVERWTRNRLENLGVRVVGRTHPSEAGGPGADRAGNDRATLRAQDRQGTTVYVHLNAVRLADGSRAVNLQVTADRSAFLWPGYFRGVTVWQVSRLGTIPCSAPAEAELRPWLNQALDQFERDWRFCNP